MVFYTSTCTHRKVWYKVKNDNHRKDGEKFEKCGITSNIYANENARSGSVSYKMHSKYRVAKSSNF